MYASKKKKKKGTNHDLESESQDIKKRWF